MKAKVKELQSLASPKPDDEDLANQIMQLQTAEASIFDDMADETYVLHAVLLHQGHAQFGHYRIFIKDHDQNRWLCYDDSIVTEVVDPNDELFGDTTGQDANASCLIYVKETRLREIVKTWLRL
jgi:ubiquitin C-terminal hydrolase